MSPSSHSVEEMQNIYMYLLSLSLYNVHDDNFKMLILLGITLTEKWTTDNVLSSDITVEDQVSALNYIHCFD